MAEIKERIGARIKQARLAKLRDDGVTPWTQGDLARRLPGTVDAASISRYENGKVKPGEDMLEALAKVLDVDVSYFVVPEPANGTADLMGALNGDETQLDRIEKMLSELLALVKQRVDPVGLGVLGGLGGQEPQSPAAQEHAGTRAHRRRAS